VVSCHCPSLPFANRGPSPHLRSGWDFHRARDYKSRLIYVSVMASRASHIITVLICRYASGPLAQIPPPSDDDAEGDQLVRDFAAQLRFAREQTGLSQEAVAARLGVTQPNISEIESGQVNVSLKTMARLANALGCALSVHLLPPNPTPFEGRVDHFIHEALRALVRTIDLLRSPAVRAAEQQSLRRRRGRPRKTN
jgi:transcriptional regulator with XRE-family HTH domain